jgi:phospholipase/carboxylesterase
MSRLRGAGGAIPGRGLTALDHRMRPAASEPAGALVLFHGRGADEDDLYPLLDALDPKRRLLGVTPRGPLELPPGGAHWYFVREIGHPDPETFRSTYRRVNAWLRALAEETGIPPDRTVLGGFSQGAVMSYGLGLASDRPRTAAIIALSGFVPVVEGVELDFTRPLPPVAIGHGTRDPVIAVDFARRARDLLQRAGADVRYRESPIPHTVDPAFVAELGPWIEQLLLTEERTA